MIVNDHAKAPIVLAADGPQEGADAVIEVQGLTAGYGDVAAVRDVSFAVHPGEVLALFGPNGAGKSTTLLGTVGAIDRCEGTVMWRGAPTSRPLHELARDGLAFVPEERSVISKLSALDNLRLGQGSVGRALELFPELEPLLHTGAGLLSGGQQQILTLARALAGDPAALVVDELSLGLAPLIVERLLAAIKEAVDTRGLAVILVEQQAQRALAIADRWLLLANGHVTASGDKTSTSEEFRSAFEAALHGKES